MKAKIAVTSSLIMKSDGVARKMMLEACKDVVTSRISDDDETID